MIITDEHLKSAYQAIQERFAAQPVENTQPACLAVSSEQVTAVCQALRDEFGFNFLSDITAVDYYPQAAPRFHVVYNLYSLPHNVRVCLRVPLDAGEANIPTLEGLFPNANWHEREMYDMFGIRFEGHSDLRRILMPYDWEGHPLRKDYPLGYEEPQFSFNYDEIAQRKHRARYEEA